MKNLNNESTRVRRLKGALRKYPIRRVIEMAKEAGYDLVSVRNTGYKLIPLSSPDDWIWLTYPRSNSRVISIYLLTADDWDQILAWNYARF